MEAIRSIQTVENGEIYLQLPKQFWGQEVEIIVLPSPQQTLQPIAQKSACGECKKQQHGNGIEPIAP